MKGSDGVLELSWAACLCIQKAEGLQSIILVIPIHILYLMCHSTYHTSVYVHTYPHVFDDLYKFHICQTSPLSSGVNKHAEDFWEEEPTSVTHDMTIYYSQGSHDVGDPHEGQ